MVRPTREFEAPSSIKQTRRSLNTRNCYFTAAQRKYAEVWHENETSIVIKMLNQSMKEHDKLRTVELQKSLLELEGKTESYENAESPVSSKELIRLLPKELHSFALALELCTSLQPTKSEGPFTVKETEYLEKVIRQNTKQYDSSLNIMIIGDSEVGKTSLMNSWLGVKNPLATRHTFG